MKQLTCILVSLLLNACATTISGHVFQDNGQPLTVDGAKVNISYLASDSSAPGRNHIVALDQDGFFETDQDLAEGYYLVEPLIPGYIANSLRIYVDQDRSLKIFAKPLQTQRSQLIPLQRDNRMDRGSGNARLTLPKM
jgi:hypothetical protein